MGQCSLYGAQQWWQGMGSLQPAQCPNTATYKVTRIFQNAGTPSPSATRVTIEVCSEHARLLPYTFTVEPL